MGHEALGDIHTLDVGLDPAKSSIKYIQCIEFADVKLCAFKWKKNIHKYSRGKGCAIVGALKYSGAGILAIKASMVSGAGIVKSLVSQSIKDLYDLCLLEAIVLPILYEDV